MNAQELINYIANAEKKTPVKLYVRENAPIDYGEGAKVFACGSTEASTAAGAAAMRNTSAAASVLCSLPFKKLSPFRIVPRVRPAAARIDLLCGVFGEALIHSTAPRRAHFISASLGLTSVYHTPSVFPFWRKKKRSRKSFRLP